MTFITLNIVLTLSTPVGAGAAVPQAPSGRSVQVPQTAASEYASRRKGILEAVSDGILLLHARSAEKEMEQWGFIQDPSFLYFTGLSDLPGAILALDGPRKQSRLFVPPPPMSFGFPVDGLVPTPGEASADKIGVNAVESWAQFADWLDGRLSSGVKTLYVDEPRRPEATGVPAGFRAVAGSLAQWRVALEARFPDARFASARASIEAMRWIKSRAEVAALRRNAEVTVTALVAVAQKIRPGMTQREAEATVVATCIESGAQGPSFWPWIMAGPNAHVGRLVHAFFHYDQLNRVMQPGELVRVDIGCGGGLYGADVGRTLPVSGTFSPGQREAWNLLIRAYRAGMDVMAAGVPLDTVRAASARAVADARGELDTDTGRRAADAILAQGNSVWHIHGVGIESGENPGALLEAGSVIAFEPMIEVGEDAFYLEDMILITSNGFDVLSKGLPYTAQEIEAVMDTTKGKPSP